MQDKWSFEPPDKRGAARALGAWVVACAIAIAFGAALVCLEARAQSKEPSTRKPWAPKAGGADKASGEAAR